MDEKDRLLAVIQSENLTSKQFADEVGILPGTVSNIVSGRNKPSLDVMQKILKQYPQISSDWLILGEGQMYRQKSDSQPTLFDGIQPSEIDATSKIELKESISPSTNTLNNPQITVQTINETNGQNRNQISKNLTPQQIIQKNIQKIVIFYDDGTFDEFAK